MNASPGSYAGATRLALIAVMSFQAMFSFGINANASSPWLSPASIAVAPDGKELYIACETGHRVLVVDLASRRVMRSFATAGVPTGLVLSSDGGKLIVTCGAPESQILLVDPAKGRTLAKLRGGHGSTAPVLSRDGRTLYVCNRFNDDVSEFELASGKEIRRIPVQREPVAAALTRDGRHLLVANLLHHGRADGPNVTAVVSVIDTATGRVVKELRLPNGSGSLHDIRVSPDGRFAAVSHILSRFYLPTTQLDRGWINTNAGTIIDLDKLEILNTVLFDSVDRGAANPWGVAWSEDSQWLVVAHSGTHEISVVRFPALLAKLEAVAKPPSAAEVNSPPPYRSPASKTSADVPNDLSFLFGVRERWPLPEGDLGPRGLVLVGRSAIVANYFSDSLSVVGLEGAPRTAESVALGPRAPMTAERRGELNFHDARLCFQTWQSCSSCHPGEARVDALNWDLLNDGLGNPKNNKSLLYAHRTPPAMSTGVRESAEVAVRAGIRHSLFTVQPPQVADDLDAYLKSLRPVSSPLLVKGRLSASARRGERLFNSRETGCARCHPAPLFTGLTSHDVGTAGPYDKKGQEFDTPTLIETWRTAPYLHDGSAATMRDVLTTRNTQQEHGKTSHLTPAQIDDLAAYVLSL